MTEPHDPVPTDPADEFELLRGVADVFARIGRQLADTVDTPAALHALTELAVDVVPGARWVSVTRGLSERFTTMASSDGVATDADRVQYRLATGPCLDAVINEGVFFSDDLALDERWSSFGPQVSRDLGVRSVVSMRLMIDDADPHLNAALNFYGDHLAAFDLESRYLATVLATHAAVAVAAVVHRDNVRNLEHALQSSREIGVAMGVLMTTYRLTRDQAFDLLRMASQNTNRKLRDVATDVADTGVLDVPRARTAASRPSRSAQSTAPARGPAPRDLDR